MPTAIRVRFKAREARKLRHSRGGPVSEPFVFTRGGITFANDSHGGFGPWVTLTLSELTPAQTEAIRNEPLLEIEDVQDGAA